MNSNSSGDSGWIFGVVMAEATSKRKEKGRRGEGGGIEKILNARKELQVLTRWYLRDRGREKSPKERMAGKRRRAALSGFIRGGEGVKKRTLGAPTTGETAVDDDCYQFKINNYNHCSMVQWSLPQCSVPFPWFWTLSHFPCFMCASTILCSAVLGPKRR